MIISLPVLVTVFFIIAIGYIIVSKIVYKKWGYTKKREEELEKVSEKDLFPRHKKNT